MHLKRHHLQVSKCIIEMKKIILLVFTLILLTDAKVTDDVNSPEDSQMSAKLQQLAKESMVATKPASKHTREAVEDCSDFMCQSSVVTYTRWGNSACPPGASVIYSGVVAGSSYEYNGSAAEPLCLPLDP